MQASPGPTVGTGTGTTDRPCVGCTVASLPIDRPTGGERTLMADRPSPIELQKHLGGMDYPAGKDEIVEHARNSGAPKQVVDTLEQIPDRQYDGPNAVSAAFSDKG